MEQGSETLSEQTIGQRRTRRAFLISLTIPWLIFAFVPRDRGDEWLSLISWWVFIYAAWWGFASALARSTSIASPILYGGFVASVNTILPSFFSDRYRFRKPEFGELVGGTLVGLVLLVHWGALIAGCTMLWRSRFTAHNRFDEPEQFPSAAPEQFSLRTLFYATTIVALLSALLAALFRTDLPKSESAGAFFFVVSSFGVWNTGLLKKLSWLLIVWLILLVWSTNQLALSLTNHVYLFQGILLGMILFPPLAYRWAGWRIVRREVAVTEQSAAPTDVLADMSS